MRFFSVSIAALCLAPGIAGAHYHILLPDKPAAQTDQPVTVTLCFGHPFEHQMFATQKPRRAVVVTPDEKLVDLNAKTEEAELPVAKGEPRPIYRWKYTPTQRGDYVFAVQCDPVWLADEGVFLEDTVKVTVHVVAQKNWDALAGARFELVPLTRPYGLRAGMVFQSLLINREDAAPRSEFQPQPGTLVEVERYNPTPPKERPPDEHITRTLKTDPGGVATVTLTEAGWWAVTAVRDAGTRQRGGKSAPVKQRTTLWVHVDDKVPLTPSK
jgi:cobalt/nickel transport protein